MSAWRDRLYGPDGTRRPDKDILKEGGDIALRLALLDDAMHRRVSGGKEEVHYPLRLFLSYKWSTEEHNAWVARLAANLQARGWDVVFDRYRDETVDRSVEEFVSRLATCRVFVAVLTPEYLAAAIDPRHPTWVFEEYQCALLAGERMPMIGLWRGHDPKSKLPAGKADQPAKPFLPRVPAIVIQEYQEPRLDEFYRVEDDASLERVLDKVLTQGGPKLAPQEEAWVSAEMAAVRGSKDDTEGGINRLRKVVDRFPFVCAAGRMLVATLRDAGKLTEALEAADLASKAVHPMDGRLSFQHERIDLFNRLGRQREAMNAAAEVVGQRPRDWIAHFHLGNILDDLGDLWAARNHLCLACQDPAASPLAFNSLGVVYMGLGLLDRAQEVLERALQLHPKLPLAERNLERIRTAPDPQGIRRIKEIAGPLPGCSECEAIFFISKERPALCAACAAHRPAESLACPHCGHDGVALVIPQGDGFLPALCPVCRRGTIVKKDKAKV